VTSPVAALEATLLAPVDHVHEQISGSVATGNMRETRRPRAIGTALATLLGPLRLCEHSVISPAALVQGARITTEAS
jgi:hypothetical protein